MLQKFKNYLGHLPKSIFYSLKYGFPSRKLYLIGVTGTDGKTTTSILIHHILTKAGYKTGLISTIGAKIDKGYITTGLHTTSPNPRVVQKLLRKMVDAGITHVVLEVTSHALDQNRFWGCSFQVGVFTNLSHEHLDYHQTMHNYLKAKAKLLNQAKIAIANADDDYFPKLKNMVKKKIITYGIKNKADYKIENLNIEKGHMSYSVNNTTYHTDTDYQYQAYNILAATAVASKLNVSTDTIADSIKIFPEAKGRRELVPNKLGIEAIVDFAHTPNALKQTLTSLRLFCQGRLIVLFGATGGRDQTKRPEMGSISTTLADVTILTSDDTRSENINTIIKQIEEGIDNKKCIFVKDIPQTQNELRKFQQRPKNEKMYFIVPNRQEAFNLAIKLSQKGDTVVACGKGHETTILHGNTEYPWSESMAFKSAFNQKNSMSSYLINGGKPLNGEVVIRGAKNASFKEVIASALTDSAVLLTNLPKISDISITNGILNNLGSQITPMGEHSQKIDNSNIAKYKLPQGVGEKSRSSIMFSPVLLHRFGKAIIPSPGGDKLGNRPLDRLFDAYKLMGIKVEESAQNITLSSKKITGIVYTFPKKSHTVTEMLIMTACLASGQTVLNNTAREPEIDDLILMLNKMGAKIQRNPENLDQIQISGVAKLSGTFHDVIADRNEAVTFATAALATKGAVEILRINPSIIKTYLDVITQMGATVNIGYDEVHIQWTQPLRPFDIITAVEPGFMTDWQAIFSILLTQTVGRSSIIERIFPNRFQHIELLNQMGAKTSYFNPEIKDSKTYYEFNPESDKAEYHHGVYIYGPAHLKPAEISTNDLRTGACATIAALTADGQSILHGAEYIKRGYEKLPERLRSLGADIKYVKN